jgi:hypothetical protein
MSSESTIAKQQCEFFVRPHHRPNLFARLSQSVAVELAREAFDFTATSRTASLYNEENIEFLALRILLQDETCIYVSYNGGSIDDENESDWNGTSCECGAIHCIHAMHFPFGAHDESVFLSLPLICDFRIASK